MAEPTERPQPRARPVRGLPLEALESRVEQLAREWAAALVLTRPLGSLDRISLGEVGSGAAELCRQVLRSLGDDDELARLLDAAPSDGGLPLLDRPAALSGATAAAAVVDAVEALRGVLWERLLEHCASAEDGLLAAACDRLAHVCASLGARAVEKGRAGGGRPWRFPERPPSPQPPRPEDTRIVIVDEQPAAPRSAPEEPAPPEPPTAGAGAGERRERGPLAPRSHREGAEIAIRDTRRDEGPSAWIRSIGAHLDRLRADGSPFAVVLLSVTPVKPGGPLPPDAELEAALAAELGAAGGGSLTRERGGRWWVVAARVDAPGAHHLAVQLESAAAALAARAGTPARIAAGSAFAPDDGTDAAALAAHADVGLYASRKGREAFWS